MIRIKNSAYYIIVTNGVQCKVYSIGSMVDVANKIASLKQEYRGTVTERIYGYSIAPELQPTVYILILSTL